MTATRRYGSISSPTRGYCSAGDGGPKLAASRGRWVERAFLVTGSRALERQGVIEEITSSLRQAGLAVVSLATVSREPEVTDVDRVVHDILGHGPRAGDLILAVGGGSAIDLGKAVAALATNRQGTSVADYLEGVGKGLKIETPPLPVLALPTTAGTGSEATKNAVISSTNPPYKKSLRSELMIPRAVLIDPELTVGLPPHVTAHTGIDAITQLIESYLSRRASRSRRRWRSTAWRTPFPPSNGPSQTAATAPRGKRWLTPPIYRGSPWPIRA